MVTTWNDAKTEATMTYKDNLPEDTYSVGVMNDTIDFGASTVAVKKQKVSKIEIGDTLAVDPSRPQSAIDGNGLWPGDGHVSYKVFDQYGVDITGNSLASNENINWTCSIGSVSASKGLLVISAHYNGDLPLFLTKYATTIITATDSDSKDRKSVV